MRTSRQKRTSWCSDRASSPKPFLNWRELATSIVQSLMIMAGSLSVYQYAVQQEYNDDLTRTMVFTVLISANIFLTLVNRSFYYSVLSNLKYKNNLVPMIIGVTIVLSGMLLYLDPLAGFFGFAFLTTKQLLLAIDAGFISVVWYEGVKWWKRRSSKYETNGSGSNAPSSQK